MMHRPEQNIQRAVFAHIRARGVPGLFAFHPANGGYRRPHEAAILQGLGLVAGVPDVILIHKGRAFALELKAPGGRLSSRQEAALSAMDEAGACVCVAEGIDRAVLVLEAWGLLRGNAAVARPACGSCSHEGCAGLQGQALRCRVERGGTYWWPMPCAVEPVSRRERRQV